MAACNMLWGPACRGQYNGMTNLLALSNATSGVGVLLRAPKAGVIDAVGISITSITGNPPPYNVAIVTVDDAGLPTVTPFGASAVQSYDYTATGLIWVTLDTPATVAADDQIAGIVWPGASAPDAANCITVVSRAAVSEYSSDPAFLYGVWTRGGGIGYGAVRYSDGEIAGGLASTGTTKVQFDSADTPDEVGNLFTLPFGATIRGVHIPGLGADSNTPWQVVLYDALDNVLASATVDDEDKIGTLEFDQYVAPTAVLAETSYRVVLKPTSGTARIQVPTFTYTAAADRAGLPEGARWQKTERTNAGAWTDTDTALTYMALWLSDIAVGGGTTINRARWL